MHGYMDGKFILLSDITMAMLINDSITMIALYKPAKVCNIQISKNNKLSIPIGKGNQDNAF